MVNATIPDEDIIPLEFIQIYVSDLKKKPNSEENEHSGKFRMIIKILKTGHTLYLEPEAYEEVKAVLKSNEIKPLEKKLMDSKMEKVKLTFSKEK